MSREPFEATTPEASSAPNFVSGNEIARGKGRRRVHASPAAKVAAYRAALKRIDYADNQRVVSTIASLAEQFGCSKNDVVKSLVRFALTNRDWRKQGLYGAQGDQE